MSFDDRDGTIWFDGELVDWRDATVHVLNHTLHYGLGVFEGVRAYKTENHGTCIFRLHEHTKRLFRSAHIVGLKIPFTEEQISQAQIDVVKANGLEEGYLRPVVIHGSEQMGIRADKLSTRVAIAGWEWPSYMGPEAVDNGIVVRTSSYTRHHPNIAMCKAKANGQYINSILALREAQQCGADEAMLLDPEGYVAEGSGENIFIIRDGIMYTPELTSCLDGITRNAIFSLAGELDLEIQEKRITRDEVYIADEAFFTGTAAEVLPIREVDGRQIGAGGRGPLTEKLQSMFFDQVRGRRTQNPEWLTPVA
ncbi:MAG: branched-chain amino acid transaminase [Pseudomonadales bacterium]